MLLALARFGGGSDSWLLDFEGLIAKEEGDYKKAIERFRSAVEADAGNTRAAGRLAVCLARDGRPDEAIEVANRLLLRGDLSSVLAYRLGEAFVENDQRHALALEWFHRAASLDPGWDLPSLCEAHCLLNLGQLDDACERYERLVESSEDPTVVLRARIGVAKALFDLGRASRALEMAKKINQDLEEQSVAPDERDDARDLLAWLEAEVNGDLQSQGGPAGRERPAPGSPRRGD